jgi:hypothetical protein
MGLYGIKMSGYGYGETVKYPLCCAAKITIVSAMCYHRAFGCPILTAGRLTDRQMYEV